MLFGMHNVCKPVTVTLLHHHHHHHHHHRRRHHHQYRHAQPWSAERGSQRSHRLCSGEHDFRGRVGVVPHPPTVSGASHTLTCTCNAHRRSLPHSLFARVHDLSHAVSALVGRVHDLSHAVSALVGRHVPCGSNAYTDCAQCNSTEATAMSAWAH
jgi:hypothetical protein